MNWKKKILWTFAVFAALAAGLAIVAVLVVKQSPSVRRVILTKMQRYASQSTGADVEIRDFKLALSPLGLQLEGIVARGRGPESAPPLLRIEHVAAEIKLDSLFKREWHLQSLVVHHPVVHVLANSGGESNLPHPQANGGAGLATIFDLAIEKCLVDGPEIYFNDAKSRLESEMYNLPLKADVD